MRRAAFTAFTGESILMISKLIQQFRRGIVLMSRFSMLSSDNSKCVHLFESKLCSTVPFRGCIWGVGHIIDSKSALFVGLLVIYSDDSSEKAQRHLLYDPLLLD